MNRLKRVYFAAVGRELHIDVPLSNVAMGYMPEEGIAHLIAPIVPTPNISGIVPGFSRADILRTEEDLRAPGTRANVVKANISSDNFYCKGRALAHEVPIEDLHNADPIYQTTAFIDGTTFITGKLMLNWESRVALQVTSGSNVGSYSAVASSWTDLTNADPLGDVNTRIDSVQDATGKRPNRVTFGETAWRYFRRNSTVRNLIFGTNNGGGYPSTQQVAALLDVQQVLVGRTYKNTGAEGAAEALTQVWGNNVLVSYAPMNPSREEPSFMYSVRWSTAGIPNMQVERHPYDSRAKVWPIEVGYYQDEKITGATYGQLLVAINSST
jgi:hypothetical protein